MKDRASKYPGRVLMTPEDGSAPFYATMERADEPTQPGDPLNKATFLTDETAALFGFDNTATPNDVLRWLGEWGQANWKLLAEFNTAGAFTFIVPDDVDELGVFILGGGASGGVAVHSDPTTVTAIKSALGGASGGLKQIVLKKIDGDFSSNEEISGVVGAGGISQTVTTKGGSAASTSGGTSAFKSIVSEYGQPADAEASVAPYGLDGIRENAFGYGGRNIFDPNDTHIYCGAGGCASNRYHATNGITNGVYQPTVVRTKGSAGAAGGGNATAPGDGGGARVATSVPATAGNGADGLVLVYGRKVV